MKKTFLTAALRALAACVVILAGRTIAATDAAVAPAAQPEKFTYIVVLHDRATKAGHERPAEPDIPAMGGEIVEQWRNRRVIRIPANGIRALVAHRAVKYIQRVQTEGALPAVPGASAIAANATIETDWAPPTWSSGTYTYDSEGNITGIGPGSDGGSETFTYDSTGRLVKAVTTHSGTHSEQYSYDSFGNLLNTTRTAGPSTVTAVDPATNRLQSAEYDSAGNVVLAEGGTAEYYYDGLNMLRAKNTSSGVAWYLYTAGDERIGVQENGQSRWMVRDLSGKVLREWEGTNTWAWVEDYVHRGGVLTAAEREPSEGGTRHFHLDHLGTPRLITDSAGVKIALHDYFPFGVEQTDFRQEMLERGTDRPEPMKFTGHERDFTAGVETNNRNQLDYMHARYYSPVWGRFLSVDPGRDWNVSQPQSWNMYSYVRNSPTNRTDPTGRYAVRGSPRFGDPRCMHVCADRPKSAPEPEPARSQETITVTAKDPGWLSARLFRTWLTVSQGLGGFSDAEIFALEGQNRLSSLAMLGQTSPLMRGGVVFVGPMPRTMLYRAVGVAEAESIASLRAFTAAPTGAEVKGFFFDLESAQNLARSFETITGERYVVVGTGAPSGLVTMSPVHAAAGEGAGVYITNESLSLLSQPFWP